MTEPDLDLDELRGALEDVAERNWQRVGAHVVTGPPTPQGQHTHPRIRVEPERTPGGKDLAARTAHFLDTFDPATVETLLDLAEEGLKGAEMQVQTSGIKRTCTACNEDVWVEDVGEDGECPECGEDVDKHLPTREPDA